MYHEDIFYPFLPMFSTFDGKMVNVVENAECFQGLGHTFKGKIAISLSIWYFPCLLSCAGSELCPRLVLS